MFHRVAQYTHQYFLFVLLPLKLRDFSILYLHLQSIYCFDQELYKSCYTEESATLRVFVDFISEVASKTHDDCLGLLEEIKLSEACTNVGFTGEEMYEGVSEICVLLEEQ